MKKITDIFKKPEPVVEEKPKMSLTQMKIKYGLFSKKCDEFIKKYQEMADKKIQRATELKLKGLNANVEIKAFAGYQAKIAGIEKRRSIFQRQIEMAEEADMQKELLGLLGDMVGVISDSYINADEIAEINDNIITQTLKANEQQKIIEGRMEELDAAMDSYDSITGADFSAVEANINAMIDQTISDARLSTENVTADDVASQVRSRLSVNA